jgi:hypothetical protein
MRFLGDVGQDLSWRDLPAVYVAEQEKPLRQRVLASFVEALEESLFRFDVTHKH